MPSCESSSLKFRVTRKCIELVRPAKPTPHECKFLSDIDDQQFLRFHAPIIQFYRHVPSMEGRDLAKIIRESLAKALVFYYPVAGRLRELPGRKLMVECTSEGVLFIDADADVKLQDFGEDDIIHSPIPCLDELIYDVPGSSGIVNCPSLLIQVTRLSCGGFIVATRFNHTQIDAVGFHQFMTGISEIARGATTPSILPVWQRELLSARHPPRITHAHHEYDHIPDTNDSIIPLNKLVTRSFFFGPEEISILRKLVMFHSDKKYSSFDLLAACIWRCRTIALQLNPTDKVRFLCIISLRNKLHPPLPPGYYGNSLVFPAGISTAGELGGNNLAYAVEVISKLKSQATKEYMQSVADFMVVKERPPFSYSRTTYIVSDNTIGGFENVDYGWGKAVYAESSVANTFSGRVSSVLSLFIPFDRKINGGKGILVPISLHAPDMERFKEELQIMLNIGDNKDAGRNVFRSSSL